MPLFSYTITLAAPSVHATIAVDSPVGPPPTTATVGACDVLAALLRCGRTMPRAMMREN
mgnify:CR=1 FL=1